MSVCLSVCPFILIHFRYDQIPNIYFILLSVCYSVVADGRRSRWSFLHTLFVFMHAAGFRLHAEALLFVDFDDNWALLCHATADVFLTDNMDVAGCMHVVWSPSVSDICSIIIETFVHHTNLQTQL